MSRSGTLHFDENNSDFYDLEYFISMEYRYFSGAHGSRVRNVMASIGDVQGLRCLDLGCGGGYFTNLMQKQGAVVTGIDYSKHAIQFGKSRYPDLDLRVQSAYKLDLFEEQSFDLVVLIDVIEHMSNHDRLLSGIYRLLKPGGRLVISTDVGNGPWTRPPWSRLVHRLHFLSSEGRAYRMITRVEAYRRSFKNYHRSHIATLSNEKIIDLLKTHNFAITSTRIFPLVAVPIRDFFLQLLPENYRGDHQCIVAEKHGLVIPD